MIQNDIADYIFWNSASPDDLKKHLDHFESATVRSVLRKVLDALYSDTVRVKDCVNQLLDEYERK